MIIKIYGERNSGTGFLEFLLRKNVYDNTSHVYVSPQVDNKCYCWKHGIPKDFDINIVKKIIPRVEKEVLYICIFRNLEGWLKSMYKNPYHMKKTGGFDNFLNKKQKIIAQYNPLDYHTKKYSSIDDEDKDIFQIRYLKMKHHLDFYNKQKNIIHISLDFLQKETKFFLHVLRQVYNINIKEKINVNIPYTKRKPKGVQLDKYNNCIYNDINMNKVKTIISSKKNEAYEKYINSLKILCKLDGQKIQ